jgi:hypothetical protein
MLRYEILLEKQYMEFFYLKFSIKKLLVLHIWNNDSTSSPSEACFPTWSSKLEKLDYFKEENN